jgi:hypothetical protein
MKSIYSNISCVMVFFFFHSDAKIIKKRQIANYELSKSKKESLKTIQKSLLKP